MFDDPRVREARRMREAGSTLTEIAAAFGVSKPTACRWTKPGNLERDREISRAWKERNVERNREGQHRYGRSARGRGLCAGCGMPKGIGSRKHTHCHGCIQAIADVRRTLAEGMWADGWLHREMAAAFGVSTYYFASRRVDDGWDLPLRCPWNRPTRAPVTERAAA